MQLKNLSYGRKCIILYTPNVPATPGETVLPAWIYNFKYTFTANDDMYENLEEKRIVDLNNPPKTIPAGEIVYKTKSGKYVCSICGYVYDPSEHDNVPFENLPEDWTCPRCRQAKSKFNPA